MRKISIVIKITIAYDERFKVTSVPYFIPDFNLLSCKLVYNFYIESFSL